MDKTIENLKAQFIVDEESYDKANLETQITKVMTKCKLSPSGRVLVEDEKMSNKDKVKLVFVARFLANKLSENISAEVSKDEIEQALNIGIDQVRARISDLQKDNFITQKAPGVYAVMPYRIDQFLAEFTN